MRTLIVLLVAVLLASCGFAPRRPLQLPPELTTMRISGADPYSPLVTGITRSLQGQGIDVLSEPAGTAAGPAGRLQILSESYTFGPLMAENVSRVQEYVSSYTVTFQLQDAQGQVVVPAEPIVLTREYVYDIASPIGTPAEQELIQEELRRDMVAAVLRRIDAALR